MGNDSVYSLFGSQYNGGALMLRSQERRYRQMVAQNRLRQAVEENGAISRGMLLAHVVGQLTREGIPLPREDVERMLDHMMKEVQ